MKKTIAVTLVTLVSFSIFSQIPKLKEIENLRESKLIIGLSGHSDVDDNFKRIVPKFWDICPIAEELPLAEALEKAKGDKSLYVIYLGSYESGSSWRYGANNVKYKSISVAYYVGISSGSKKAIMYSGIPVFNEEFSDEAIAHGTNYINQMFSMMLDEEINAMKTLGIIKKNGSMLEDRTLYIPEWMLDKKLAKEEIAEHYQGTIEFVSDFEWSRAILNKKEGVAYSIVIPAAVGGSYVFQHHICDAKTGKILGIKYPKPAVSIGAGKKMYNLSSGNKGFVAKKNLKQYNDVLKGK